MEQDYTEELLDIVLEELTIELLELEQECIAEETKEKESKSEDKEDKEIPAYRQICDEKQIKQTTVDKNRYQTNHCGQISDECDTSSRASGRFFKRYSRRKHCYHRT